MGKLAALAMALGLLGIMLYLITFAFFLIYGFVGIGLPVIATPETIGVNPVHGFVAGLFHGFICLVSFVASWFYDDVTIYSANNTGGWYNFGYIIGVYMAFGSSSSEKK